MSAPAPRNRARRSARRPRAQAVVETAIVIPIMLFLITGFIALMIQVELQQQLDAATKLAAESTFQAPRSEVDPPPYATAGIPTRCRYAVETFEGTMSFFFNETAANEGSDAVFTGTQRQKLTNAYLNFITSPECQTETAGYGAPPPQVGANNPPADIHCDLDYQDANVSSLHMTLCTSKVKLDYSKTPLAWAIFWSPTLTSTAEAAPPPFRQ